MPVADSDEGTPKSPSPSPAVPNPASPTQIRRRIIRRPVETAASPPVPPDVPREPAPPPVVEQRPAPVPERPPERPPERERAPERPPMAERPPERFNERPQERFNDRPPERERPPERFNDRPPERDRYNDRPPMNDRPPERFNDRPPFRERGPMNDRPPMRGPMNDRPYNDRPYNDRPPQGRDDRFGPRGPFIADRPPQRFQDRNDRPPHNREMPPHREPAPDGPVPQMRPDGNPARLDDLYRLPMSKLFSFAEAEGVSEHSGLSRAQLIVAIVRRQIERGVVVRGSGTLEVFPDGYGFLRSQAHNYLASPEDIYVSPSQIRRMTLKTGLVVEGPIRLPIEGQDNFALMQVELVNGTPADQSALVTGFDDLIALHPSQRFNFESGPDDLSGRVVDLVSPVGMGQRGLIVSPPRAGKTVLLQRMAMSIVKNHPDCYVIVLLVDERPEEVTDMQRTVVGPNVEVVASTFDEPPQEHIHVAEMVLEKAKRLVERKRDVVILMDSITRMARAYNNEAPPGGKLLSGGLDANAIQKPRRFFAAARNVEEGGSLTILATALIDTGSKLDDVIFEEFKGTGNSELHLDRRLVEKRVWPAIDINRSGTRKEELLMAPEEAERIRLVRKILSDMHPVEAMEFLTNKLRKTKSNVEFLLAPNLT